MSLFGNSGKQPLASCASQIPLQGSVPELKLEGVSPGVDNLRHDVYLSPRLTEAAVQFIGEAIRRHGEIHDLLPLPRRQPGAEAGSLQKMLPELLAAALSRAKQAGNPYLENLCWLAVIRLFRRQMASQFAGALELCQRQVRDNEGPQHYLAAKGIELRNRAARFQLAKRNILRTTAADLFTCLRCAEKATLAPMRRSFFGSAMGTDSELFLNRMLLLEDAGDDRLNAEYYVLLGNYEQDLDRFSRVEAVAGDFLHSLGYECVEPLLNQPENAHALFGSLNARDPLQKQALGEWTRRLQSAQVLNHVIAAYETASLLRLYSPPIHPQQLKHALVFGREQDRVLSLLQEHGNINTAFLVQGAQRVRRCGAQEKSKLAARFFYDFLRYHRDLRRRETVLAAMLKIRLVDNPQMRELSAVNRTLYEFLLPQEQRPEGQAVVHHAVLKADIRDSTHVTHTLLARGLNPASFFSLNFYDPISRLLPRFGAQKLFIEGDAIILGWFERQAEPEFAVSRACALAQEMMRIIRACNRQSQSAGLPTLEVGIGISYQDSSPLYLMDGKTPIMISPALNASDRLSSCSKPARRCCRQKPSRFSVLVFQNPEVGAREGPDSGSPLPSRNCQLDGQPEDFLVRYNLGGIALDEAAFAKLQREISMTTREVELSDPWSEKQTRLHTGTVVAPGTNREIVVREARAAQVDTRDFSLIGFADYRYFELCVGDDTTEP